MEPQKMNKEIMITGFLTIVDRDAGLKEAYEGIQKTLEESPHLPGLVVTEKERNYSGVLTLADFMNELRKLYRDACDETEGREWMASLFLECELILRKNRSTSQSWMNSQCPLGSSREDRCLQK